jgi:taurine dioxygenase
MDELSADIGQNASALYFNKVGVHLGVEVGGIDLRQNLDDKTQQALRNALVEHQVLVFRDQDISVEDQLRFGRSFGELSVHPIAAHDEEIPELQIFDNDENNQATFTNNWHTDETFREIPPLGTILRAHELPAVGGNTLFASMTAAYDGLSDRLQTYISGLEAVHDVKLFRLGFTEDEEGRKLEKYINENFPKVTHPVVREHPVSKKKVLFVNPHFTLNIKGMGELESQNLLQVLYHQAEIPEYQYRHIWQPHTIVMWDNRSTQHYAPRDYTERRRLHRVTVKGTESPYAPA